MSNTTLASHVTGQIKDEARTALDTSFETFRQRRQAMSNRRTAGPNFTEAMLRTALQDEQIEKLRADNSRSTGRQLLATLRQNRYSNTTRKITDAPAARALTTRPFKVMDNHQLLMAEDSHLQVLGPPYADQWTTQSQSGNAEVHGLSADRETGNFGYFIGSADGSAACGAGVWAQFVPTRSTQAQVRAYTPYNYQYDLDSQYGYTAHDDGGFGIFVLSWNFDGTGRFNDLDYRYSAWSDGTGWWEEHRNPGAPGS